jgi:hypothetical protein
MSEANGDSRITEDLDAVLNAAAKEATKPESDRATICAAEVRDVLRKHSCAILSSLNPPKLVGPSPVAEFLISSTYSIYAIDEK